MVKVVEHPLQFVATYFILDVLYKLERGTWQELALWKWLMRATKSSLIKQMAYLRLASGLDLVCVASQVSNTATRICKVSHEPGPYLLLAMLSIDCYC